MGQIRKIILLFFCTGLMLNLGAQENFYKVKLGTFVSPHHEDFEAIHQLGFVYSDPKAANHELISIGDYTTYEKAVEVMQQVRQSGFPDAIALLKPMPRKERRIPVVQMAQIPAIGKKDWGAFFRAHPTIYARQLDGLITVYAGGFDDEAAAKISVSLTEGAGFTGAFAKMIKTNHLQSVKEFESGIEMQIATAPAQPTSINIGNDVLTAKSAELPVTEIVVAPATPAPVVSERVMPSVETQPIQITTSEPSTTTKQTTIAYPSINAKVKRNAAIEIQKILKTDKIYSGSLDGFYGEGTGKAFEAFTKSNRQWKKYQVLTDLWKVDADATGADLWKELRILRTITSEINGGQGKFKSIVLNDKSLSTEERQSLKKWNESLWANISGWSKRDPLHAEISKVLKVGFFQAQIRVEEHFISKGVKPLDARWMAIRSLKTAIGDDLDRFGE